MCYGFQLKGSPVMHVIAAVERPTCERGAHISSTAVPAILIGPLRMDNRKSVALFWLHGPGHPYQGGSSQVRVSLPPAGLGREERRDRLPKSRAELTSELTLDIASIRGIGMHIFIRRVYKDGSRQQNLTLKCLSCARTHAPSKKKNKGKKRSIHR